MSHKIKCKICCSEIEEQTIKCPVCLSNQNDMIRGIKKITKIFGAIGALVGFIVAAYPLYPVINRAWFPSPSIEVFSINTKLTDKLASEISLFNDGNIDIFINKIEFKSIENEFNKIKPLSIIYNDWIKIGGISVKKFARPRENSSKWSYLTIGGFKKRIALIAGRDVESYIKSCFQLKVYDKSFNKSPFPEIIDLIPVKASTYYSSTKSRKIEVLNSKHTFGSLIGFYEDSSCEPKKFKAKR